MDNNYWSIISIKLKLYRDGSGESLQKLFSDIMVRLNPEFKRFRPYGNVGDGGNDGYIPNENHYYQCYGPAIHSQTIAPHKKAKEDFAKLIGTGVTVEHWSFVFNDYYSGEYQPLKDCLKDIKKTYKLNSVSLINCDEIERLFLQLPSSEQKVVAPLEYGIPHELDLSFKSGIMKEVINYIFEKIDMQSSMLAIGTNEELQTKIQFNGLSYDVSTRLNMYSKYTNILDNFLASTPSAFDDLARHMKKLYLNSCEVISGTSKYTPDLRYYMMQQEIIPQNVDTMQSAFKNQYITCADIVLAKYFEGCDIYEH